MNIRKFATLCSVTTLLGFALAACAVDGTEEETSSEGSDALQATKPPAKVNKCLTVRCSSGYTCEPATGRCLPNVVPQCANVRCAAGTKNIPGLGCCLKTCGGIQGAVCSGDTVCVDDPTDSCDPNRGGADCSGVCVPPPPDCRTLGCGRGSYCSACPTATHIIFSCIPNGAAC